MKKHTIINSFIYLKSINEPKEVYNIGFNITENQKGDVIAAVSLNFKKEVAQLIKKYNNELNI